MVEVPVPDVPVEDPVPMLLPEEVLSDEPVPSEVVVPVLLPVPTLLKEDPVPVLLTLNGSVMTVK